MRRLGDEFSHDGDGDFFWRDGSDINADGGVDAGKLLGGNAFFFQLFVDGDGFALRADHADITRRSFSGPAKHAHIVTMAAGDDDDVRRIIGREL